MAILLACYFHYLPALSSLVAPTGRVGQQTGDQSQALLWDERELGLTNYLWPPFKNPATNYKKHAYIRGW